MEAFVLSRAGQTRVRDAIVAASFAADQRQLMSLGTRIHTWRFGEIVGTDGAGNRYYRDRRTKGQPREGRWVLYAGEAEASKVPPEWHGWLHKTVKEPPTVAPPPVRPWQQPHQPNLTGSPLAYRPPGHPLKGGQRARGTGDYEPWIPS